MTDSPDLKALCTSLKSMGDIFKEVSEQISVYNITEINSLTDALKEHVDLAASDEIDRNTERAVARLRAITQDQNDVVFCILEIASSLARQLDTESHQI